MTRASEFELLELATPYALNAVTEEERIAIERQVAEAPPSVANAFGDEVRAVGETMAVIAASTGLEPPAELRAKVLAAVNAHPVSAQPRRFHWRTAILAAAAVLLIGLGAVGAGLLMRPPAPTSAAAQVFSAADVRTANTAIPGGGTATVVFSREQNAGVLVMNNVAPPQAGTVYEMWLIGDRGPVPAGTMDAQSITPSTTRELPDLLHSRALAFTVEPGTGSPHPTGSPIAELPLL